ncbi:MAG: universal stress protein [Alphaproteobacteria bacterium]|nr:universal stress protein [Alphaproteobacteria bacterium]
MALKDILVQLDGTPQSAVRLDVAAELARQHSAHLTGLHVIDPILNDPMLYGDASGLAVLIDQARGEAQQAAGVLEAKFRECLRADGIVGEWRLAEGRTADAITLHARYVDLVVLGQQDPENPRFSGWGAVIEQALFSSGRPLLIVPYAGKFDTVGRNVLIGWSATRESARAVADALPLIAAADNATVLAIDPQGGLAGHGEVPAADIARHLARHDIKVTAAHTPSGGVSPGDVLLNYATDNGTDLLVIGGYGHSRVRELVMGGVTRTILQRMTIPVLMSH